MRIALVGPTHPYKGGVAVHTTDAAQRLAAAGHDVDLVSWARLYPARLYPGELTVPGGVPETPPYPRTVRVLRWDAPGTWWRAGRRLRGHDLLVLVTVVPAQAPALLTIARAAGARPARVVLAHNVAPHETHPGGRWLMARLLRGTDAVLVHSARQGDLATGLGARRVAVAGLPPTLPGGRPPVAVERSASARVRVLALGIVRDYTGIDLLLQAAREVPGVEVTVAGELWGAAGVRVMAAAADPALTGRVRLGGRYVPDAEVPALLAGHDVLALPYRDGTASQNVLLGHSWGMPVLASRVAAFGEQVRDGIDGLLVPPGDVAALRAALERLAAPGGLEALRAGVTSPDLDGPWAGYLSALCALAEGR